MSKNKAVVQPISASIVSRPPFVCVLGHVDHGKTTLLDYIRKTQVVAKENGGITQHIGAYQVKLKTQSSKLKASKDIITFIDTPGHAAFNKIRSRGTQVADLAVLVIDAVEGVKPQTIESLKLLQENKTSFLIAFNKTDLPEASVDKVKAQLAERGVLVEGYGGQVVAVPISAKTGKGVDELLEMIVLQAEMLELKADPSLPGEAVVIETKLDSRRGILVTLLVKNGSFHSGDYLLGEHNLGKIKAMFDENGKPVMEAGPAKPVEILGFKEVPAVGSLVKVTDKRQAKLRETGRTKNTEKSSVSLSKFSGFSVAKKASELSETEGIESTENNKKLKIILKADVSGSLEAIKASLPQEVFLLSEGTGDVNESDILRAASAKALILAFRVSLPKQVEKLAEYEKVTIKSYQIIYQLLEDIEKQALLLLEPTFKEAVLGEAKVIAEFKIKGSHIAGCKVNKGKFKLGDKVHIKREDKLIADSKIKNMQKTRQEVTAVKAGDEVGLVFSPDIDFKIGDDIISYKNF